MRKLYIIAAALLTFVNCSNEEEILNDNQKSAYHSFAAVIEQGTPDSRGAIDANNHFVFFENEVIRIFVDDPNTPHYDYQFNNTTGTFIPKNTAIPSGTTIIGAYYGGSSDDEVEHPDVAGSGSLDGHTLNIGLPQNTQFITHPKNNVLLPMWGEIDANGIYFKHLAGVLRINMSNLPEGFDFLAVHSSNDICSDFVVEDITDDKPFMVSTGSSEDAGLMTIKFPPVTASTTNKTLYIPLPVGNYQNIQVLVSKDENLDEGNYQDAITLAYWENKKIERATIYTANLDCNVSKYNLDLVESVFANGGFLTLTENVALDEPLTVASGKTVKLNLNGFTLTTSSSASSASFDITNHGTLLIEDGIIRSKNGVILSDGDLKLEDCEVSTDNNQTNTIQITDGTFDADDCEITNTATQAATNGNDYYVLNIQDAEANLSVEVSSKHLGGIQVANSTLSLNGGTYKAGNFHPLNIENATVNFTSSATFTPATGNVIINATAGSTINGEILTNNTSIQCITSLAEIQSAFSTGGIYMQTADIELNAPLALAAGKSLTLNMCNRSLTTTDDVTHAIINEGTLTLKEANIQTANTAIWSKSGKLSLEACTFTTTNRVNVLTATGGTVLVKGGSFHNNAPQADTDASQHIISLKNVSDAQINQGEIHSQSLGGICIDNSKLTLNDSNCMVAKFYGLYLVNSSNVTHINSNIMCFKEEYADIFASAGCTVNGTSYTVDTPLHQ